MNSIIDALKSLKVEVFKTTLLHAVLDTGIVILLANLGLYFAGIDLSRIVISIIIGSGFFVFDFIKKYNSFKIKTFEKYNPEVSEMLRTAYDNASKENEITKELFKNVIKKLKFSSTYQLIQHKRAMTKIGVLFILSLSTMTFAVIKIDFPQFSTTSIDTLETKIQSVDILRDDSIYGARSNIEIGEREMELILSSSTNINLDNIKNVEEVDFQRENFPIEVVAQAEATSEEEIPEDFELIKNYNIRIRGIQ